MNSLGWIGKKSNGKGVGGNYKCLFTLQNLNSLIWRVLVFFQIKDVLREIEAFVLNLFVSFMRCYQNEERISNPSISFRLLKHIQTMVLSTTLPFPFLCSPPFPLRRFIQTWFWWMWLEVNDLNPTKAFVNDLN